MATSNISSYGGIGLSSLLTVAFVVLKLTKVISWSWFWVLSPAIFSAAIGILIVVGVLVYIAVSDK